MANVIPPNLKSAVPDPQFFVAALAPRSFFSNLPINDSNFDIGGVRKAFSTAEEVYALFEPLDAKPPMSGSMAY